MLMSAAEPLAIPPLARSTDQRAWRAARQHAGGKGGGGEPGDDRRERPGIGDSDPVNLIRQDAGEVIALSRPRRFRPRLAAGPENDRPHDAARLGAKRHPNADLMRLE